MNSSRSSRETERHSAKMLPLLLVRKCLAKIPNKTVSYYSEESASNNTMKCFSGPMQQRNDAG
jgi:hypothetical protein